MIWGGIHTLGDASISCFKCGESATALRPDGVRAPRGVARGVAALASRGDSSTVNITPTSS